MILVVGATGLLGGEICRQLRESGHDVRGLVRIGSPKVGGLKALGVQIAVGDLKEPDSLDLACRGATAVITTANSTVSRRARDGLQTVDRDGQLALVSAAQRAGVQQFVYTSVSPSLPRGPVFVNYKREVEHAVRTSGMAWTVLQPARFMEIWFSPALGWNVEAGKLTIFGPGNSPNSYIAIRDAARFAVLAIERPELRDLDLPVGGPAAVTENEAARIFELAVGRPLKRVHIPLAALRLMSAVLRPFDPIKSSLIAMAVETASDPKDMNATLSQFPVELLSVSDYARQSVTYRPSQSREPAAPASPAGDG